MTKTEEIRKQVEEIFEIAKGSVPQDGYDDAETWATDQLLKLIRDAQEYVIGPDIESYYTDWDGIERSRPEMDHKNELIKEQRERMIEV